MELFVGFVVFFVICVIFFLFYLGYVCYLKKYRGYRYDDGVPDVAILRPSTLGSAGIKGFSAGSFRSSQMSLTSLDRARLIHKDSSRRPRTFPLSSSQSSSSLSQLPEIKVELVP